MESGAKFAAACIAASIEGKMTIRKAEQLLAYYLFLYSSNSAQELAKILGYGKSWNDEGGDNHEIIHVNAVICNNDY